MLRAKGQAFLALVLFLFLAFALNACGGGGGGIPEAPEIPPIPGGGGGGGGGSINHFDPSSVPGAPSSTPPRLSSRLSQAPGNGVVTVQMPMAAGWNLISFPLASLTSASGFTHALYQYTPSGYLAVDPVNYPGSIDTTLAYWAWFDQPATVTVTGEANTGQLERTHLIMGWNLVGCPATSSLPWASITTSHASGVTRVVEEAVDHWLYEYVFPYSPGVGYSYVSVLGSGSALTPQQGAWVFAWQDVDLNLPVSAPSPPPVISSLSASSVAPGDTLTITGSGFGTQGLVTIGGVPVQEILSWTDTQILCTVPVGALSGSVVVMVDFYPSNRVSLTVNGGSGSGTGSISGQVLSSSGAGLAQVTVMADSGQSTTTDSSGYFTLSGISAGDHLFYFAKTGYRTSVVSATILAGYTVTGTVTLYPAGGGGGGGGGGNGTLRVRGYAYESGGQRYYASRILVYEYGNYSNRWSDVWYTDYGYSYNELVCQGATQGVTYRIEITWTGQDGRQVTGVWDRVLSSSDQTERFYNP